RRREGEKDVAHHGLLWDADVLRTVLAEDGVTLRGEVNSHHHQGIDRLGTGLVPLAVAPDGLVEAVAEPGPTFRVGVQWHPDLDSPPHPLLATFVRRAGER